MPHTPARRSHSSVLVLAASFVLAGCSTAMRDGWRAHRGGDFAAALTHWTPLAEHGDADAQYLVGVVHDEGRGVARDALEAARWYRLAAQRGHAPAQNNLALLHHRGDGVAKSTNEAVRWFELAAANGYVPALRNRAVLHLFADPTRADVAAALPLLREATTRGDAVAPWILASLSGDTFAPDTNGSPLRLAAERGHPRAQHRLGWMYLRGEGVERDPAAAAHWLTLAAEQGIPVAQAQLAQLHVRGEGVPQDEAAAARWWSRAAEQGFAPSQHDLGLAFFQGRGVAQDPAAAQQWWRRAAGAGHVPAAERLNALGFAAPLAPPRD